MRAVLLVPDTERIGLTGKPLINQQGIVGSLKGSFVAGQRVTLINLRGISAKIAEAQRAISGADDNIRRSGETIDDIKDGSKEISKIIDYWTRWDRKGVQDEYANVQFLSTALAMDKVRTAMLGESVDPYPFYSDDLIIPRGFYWDPVFRWRKHTLDVEKNRDFLIAYGESGLDVAMGESISGVISTIAMSIAKVVAVVGTILALNTAISAQTAALPIIAKSMWIAAPATKAAGSAVTQLISGFCFVIIKIHTVVSAQSAAIFAVTVAFDAAFAVIVSLLKNYRHVELMGEPSYTSTYSGSYAQQNTLSYNWYTYAYVSKLTSLLLSSVFGVGIISAYKIIKQQYKAIKALQKVTAKLIKIGSMPDIPSEHGANPNAEAIAEATSTLRDLNQIVRILVRIVMVQKQFTKDAVLKSIGMISLFVLFTVTRINGGKVPANHNDPFSFAGGGPDKNANVNITGNSRGLPIDGYLSAIGAFATLGSNLGQFTGSLTGFISPLVGGSGRTASNVCAGGPNARDSYIQFKPNRAYIDWWGKRLNFKGWTAQIDSIQGVEGNTQTFYGKLTPRTISSVKSSNVVCWSHVFDGNIFAIRSSQIGNRSIEKTIIVKTRSEYPTGLYLAFQVLVKCRGEDKLHLVLERDMERFTEGSGSDVMLIEQVWWNIDPENAGDFFTGHRGGKISEVFAYTFDGHIISYRPNMEWKDNFLLGDFINREVTHFEKFTYKTYPPTNRGEGHLDSYLNPY